MNGTKKWWNSTAVNNGIIAVGLMLVSILGAAVLFFNTMRPGTITEEEAQTFSEQLPNIVTGLVAVLTGIAAVFKTVKAIFGRLRAKEEIG